MTEREPEDELAEFAAELKLLAEAVLERVEPVLRRSAATGRADWESCSWCPVCAAAALVRGERHDVLAAIADHGTAIVTVLREALAGVPVEPVRFDPEPGVPHEHSRSGSGRTGARADPAATDGPPGAGHSDRAHPGPATFDPGESGTLPSVADESAESPPRADESGAGRPDIPGAAAGDPPGAARKRRFRRGDSGYVDIPVTVRR
ncbi:hypothetical protein [Nocardia harenae]|uniref:hypothetical protein n=1 Tax=Nocardia harenae TaxID=358707 RepID=UPI000A5C9359|nr:hypothetical protein [Nocardia harenae]